MGKLKQPKKVRLIVKKDNLGFYANTCYRLLPCDMTFIGRRFIAINNIVDEECNDAIIYWQGQEVPTDGPGVMEVSLFRYNGAYHYIFETLEQYLEKCADVCGCNPPYYYNDGGIGEGNLDIYLLSVISQEPNGEDPLLFTFIKEIGGTEEFRFSNVDIVNNSTFSYSEDYTLGFKFQNEESCYRVFEYGIDKTSEWVKDITDGFYKKSFSGGQIPPIITLTAYRVVNQILWDWNINNFFTTKTIRIVGDICAGATIDWGNGETTPLVVGDNSYAGYPANGTYQVVLTYKGVIKQINLEGNFIVNFGFIDTIPNHVELLVLDNNELVAWDNSLALPVGFKALSMGNNNLTVFDPFSALPSSLTQLAVYGMLSLTEFNPSIALPPNLIVLNLRDNGFTSFGPTIPIPSSITNLHLENNNFDSNAVNDVLIYLDEVAVLSNAGINIETVMNVSPPTGLGLVAKANLEARGCTVLTD